MLLGVGLLISQSILLLNILKLIGAVYLLWLGITMLRAKPEGEEVDRQIRQMSDWQALKVGFLQTPRTQTTLFVVSVFVQVVNPGTPLMAQIGYGLFMAMTHVVWFTIVACSQPAHSIAASSATSIGSNEHLCCPGNVRHFAAYSLLPSQR